MKSQPGRAMYEMEPYTARRVSRLARMQHNFLNYRADSCLSGVCQIWQVSVLLQKEWNLAILLTGRQQIHITLRGIEKEVRSLVFIKTFLDMTNI
jgi:hypothetical protein